MQEEVPVNDSDDANTLSKRVLEMEYKLSQMMVNRNDFAEGIEAVLIKKHHNPNWSPKSIDTINLKEIDDFLETNTSQIF